MASRLITISVDENDLIFAPPDKMRQRKKTQVKSNSSSKSKSKMKYEEKTIKVVDYGRAFILHIDSFLSQEECLSFIRWCEKGDVFEDCDFAATRDTAQRKQGRYAYPDDEGEISGSIYRRLLPILPEKIDGKVPCCCSRNIRFYKYMEGDSFGKHIDESHFDEESQGESKLTLLLYLNGNGEGKQHVVNSVDCDYGDSNIYADYGFDTEELNALEGGSTLFYKAHTAKDPFLAIEPKMGSMLLHGHGHRCCTHEGSVVTRGAKYILRTDVIYK